MRILSFDGTLREVEVYESLMVIPIAVGYLYFTS